MNESISGYSRKYVTNKTLCLLFACSKRVVVIGRRNSLLFYRAIYAMEFNDLRNCKQVNVTCFDNGKSAQ